MSNNEADALFQGGGDGTPSFDFGDGRILDPNHPQYTVGRHVAGTIVSTSVMDQTDMATKKPKLDRDGNVKKQLAVILQTAHRNWEAVKKIPTDEHGQQLPPSADDGKRAIYVAGWMTGAVGDAVRAATNQVGAPRVGGKLAVRVSELAANPGGNPFRKYEARYEPPAAGAEMFQQGPPPQQQPTQGGWNAPPAQQGPPPQQWQQPTQPQQAPPAQGGWDAQPPVQQHAAPPQQPPVQPPAAAGDPWASSQPGWDNEPPY